MIIIPDPRRDLAAAPVSKREKVADPKPLHKMTTKHKPQPKMAITEMETSAKKGWLIDSWTEPVSSEATPVSSTEPAPTYVSVLAKTILGEGRGGGFRPVTVVAKLGVWDKATKATPPWHPELSNLPWHPKLSGLLRSQRHPGGHLTTPKHCRVLVGPRLCVHCFPDVY